MLPSRDEASIAPATHVCADERRHAPLVRATFGMAGRLLVQQMPGRSSGAGDHVCREDVVGVAVEGSCGHALAHRRPRVGMARSDLNVAQVDVGVERG